MDPKVYQNRQKKLSERLVDADLQAFLFNPGPSLTYFTGLHFHLSERPVVVILSPKTLPVIVLPELETGKTDGLAYPVQVFPYGEDPGTWVKAFESAGKFIGLAKGEVAAEPRQLRLLELRLLEQAVPDMVFINGQDHIASLRMFKSVGEVAAMRKAAEVAESALENALKQFQMGMTEKDLAAELTLQLLRNGSNPRLPFFPIVASGPNSANPHAFPTNRKISSGDLLIIDWGANIDDYFSDITRTFSVGDVGPDLLHIHDIVMKANAAAREKAGPGVAAGEVDLAARSVIETANFGKEFIHRTGHGLGMEGHEEPYIRKDNKLKLQPGMAITIEPGIYLKNKGGVRIEDDVVITPDGINCLTSLSRGLIRLN